MGLLKKGKKKPLKTTGRGAAGTLTSALRPQQVTKLAPCAGTCPSGNDIRGWLTAIAQREKEGLDEQQAYSKAFYILAETNPFPSVMGRVCPHPCEGRCNRELKDGAVSINACERFLGDWALEQKLPLKAIDEEAKPESVGVLGAGPAGLTFAYQMARRGYKVTVYEKTDKVGGMLYWGIPFYRLPAEVLEAEVQRILDMGVELKLNCAVGKDVTVEELREKHAALFLGIGAHKGKNLRVAGEEGPGFWTGTDYLHKVNLNEAPDLGDKVVVIGGGDTAIDAAREARRTGAEVSILYRRTRVEMPAIESEIEDALLENIDIEYLVAPVGVKRDGDELVAMIAQKMELGEPDDSGRRRPVPIEGSEYEVPCTSIIAAVSQEADWQDLDALKPETRWLEPDPTGKVQDDVWAGGDVIDLGIAVTAMAHGTRAAEAIHYQLRGVEPPRVAPLHDLDSKRVKLEIYEAADPTELARRPVEEWVGKPLEEINLRITEEQFQQEVNRCFSCGFCYGCEKCWMYCTPGCFKKVKPDVTGPGSYYTIDLGSCDGCKKCADECPCGYLDMI